MRTGFFLFFFILTTSVTAQSGPCSGHGEFIHSGQLLGGVEWSLGVDVGDVNGDGNPDLVFARWDGLGNRVYLGDGSGLFTETGQSLGANGSTDIALADLDMDGDLDMVVANAQVGSGSGQPNKIYFNDGLNTGNFIDSGQSLGNDQTMSVAAGDINGDNYPDLVFFNTGANCTVHLNDGTGGFGSPSQSIPMNRCHGGKLTDLNGDGHLDLAIPDLFNPDQKIFINDGSGSFTFHSSVTVPAGLWSIAVADVDGDTLPDLICGASGANQIFINDGSANFTDSGQLLGTAGTRDIAAGDIDGDCDPDLVFADEDGFFRIYQNDGGNFVEIAINDDEGTALQLTDVNHDDTLDLIVARGVQDMVHLNLGPGSDCNGNGIADNFEISADPSLDCDGNGAIDLCEFSSDPFLDCDENEILDSCEDGFVDSGQALGNYHSEDVALGDFDGDGDLDAWVANRYTQSNHVWINDGSGNFTGSQALGNHDSFAVDIGDLDGDGDLDAWVTNRNEPNHVWINDGMGNFTDSGQNLGNLFSTDVSLGDVDGDGDLDAWVANYGQANRVWLNQGGDQGGTPGTFADSGQVLGNSNSLEVALGDLDGDGDLDAWVANYSQANRVWINDGLGNFADSSQALGNSESRDIALGDLDGDGDL
ncbi:MAG: VCBS repeat-containing protein, partial [Planctomycetota bacterium]|nr:VCBS repeat-containing protein [Planctomycetota bacterium]